MPHPPNADAGVVDDNAAVARITAPSSAAEIAFITIPLQLAEKYTGQDRENEICRNHDPPP